MRYYSLAPLFRIQLFGEGAGGGDGGTGAGGTAGAAAPAGQVNEAALAQPQTGVKNPLANVKYGKQEDAPAAEVAKPAETDRNAQFEALIKGEYKDLYDAKVQDTIRTRLSKNEQTVARYNELSPVLGLLADKYGVDANDVKALRKAIEDDETFYEDEAMEKGLSVAQVKEMRKMQRENAELRAQMQQQQNREQAERLYAAWMQESEAVKQVYPNFDLRTELQNENFRSLLRSNVPVKTAFEVIHKDEILSAGMQYTAKRVEEKLANNVRAGGRRPAEGAMGGQNAVITKSDVSKLTKADRDEIDRRVARGEKIRF